MYITIIIIIITALHDGYLTITQSKDQVVICDDFLWMTSPPPPPPPPPQEKTTKQNQNKITPMSHKCNQKQIPVAISWQQCTVDTRMPCQGLMM